MFTILAYMLWRRKDIPFSIWGKGVITVMLVELCACIIFACAVLGVWTP